MRLQNTQHPRHRRQHRDAFAPDQLDKPRCGQAIFEDLGIQLENVQLSDLGRAKRIVIDKDNTTVIEGLGKTADLKARTEQIRRELANSTSDYDKEKLEEQLRKTGDRFGEITVTMAMVDGITCLRIEHDVINPIDNSRARLIKIAIPGNGRRFDIVFNFSPEQTVSVEPAVATVQRSFKVNSHPALDPETKNRWTRILLWTVGGFALGIILSILLKVLSGVGESEPKSTPQK